VYELLDEHELAVERKRLYGVYPAEVTNVRDPDGQGRVKIRLPWSPDTERGYEVWARLVPFMAGGGRGAWFIPDPREEVLVMFEGGDPRRPYVIGALWNGTDAPPESMDEDGKNYKKSIVSRRNIRITLDDTEGHETITIQTPGGQRVTIKDGPGLVELRDRAGNSIKLEPQGMTITAASKLTINGGTTMEINASMLTVNAPTTNFSGTTQCPTHLANTVISGTYMPGVGNLL